MVRARAAIVLLVLPLMAGVTAVVPAAAGLRLALLPAGGRESVAVEFDGDVPAVALLPEVDDRTIRVSLGPLPAEIAAQRLEAPATAALVREIRVEPARGRAGWTATLQVLTRQPASASLRRARGRLYIDVSPRAAARRPVASPPVAPVKPPASVAAPSASAAPAGGVVVPRPRPTTGAIRAQAPDTATVEPLAPSLLAQLLPSAREVLPPSLVRVAQPLPASTVQPWTTLVTPLPPPLAPSSADPPDAAPAAAIAERTPPGLPAWPAPPAPARIRFRRSLDPRSVRGRPSPFSRLLTALTGSRREPSMTQPYGIAVGPDQRVYVADTDGGLIHVYDVGRSGYSAIKVEAGSLIGIVFLGDRLVVTDSESGRVICLDQKGKELWSLGRRQGFERPTGLAAGGDRLFVVDTMRHKVVVISANGQVIDTFGSRGSAPGQLNFPTNIARGRDGRLYVTDSMNFRVQIFNQTGQHLHTFGRLGDGTGDFEKPKGIALDSAGHVYVVEGLHDVVQVFDEDGQLLLAFGGSGAGAGQLWLPSGIAIANDIVYVADSSNRRVQVFDYLGGAR